MIIGVPAKTAEGERRVALVPESVARLIAQGFVVQVGAGAGEGAWISDDDYRRAGAKIETSAECLLGTATARKQSWCVTFLDCYVLKTKKILVSLTVLICIWNAAAKIQQLEAQTSPYLSFKFLGVSEGKSPRDAITLKTAERAQFQIQYVTSAPYRATKGVHYGPLSLDAINQHPDFFKERPGPTVSLEVKRIGPNEGQLLPSILLGRRL